PPHRQHADAVADSQPRAARAELFDDADELIARRERRLRPAEIGAGAQLRVGERYAGGQHPDADFAPPGARRLRLHELENLGTAEPRDDNSLHGPGRSARSLRAFDTNKPQRRGGRPTCCATTALSPTPTRP